MQFIPIKVVCMCGQLLEYDKCGDGKGTDIEYFFECKQCTRHYKVVM